MNIQLIELAIHLAPGGDHDRVHAEFFDPAPYPPQLGVEAEELSYSTDRREPAVAFDVPLPTRWVEPDPVMTIVRGVLRDTTPRVSASDATPDAMFRLTLRVSRPLLAPVLERLGGYRSSLPGGLPGVVVHVVPRDLPAPARPPLSLPLTLALAGEDSPSVEAFNDDWLDGFSRSALRTAGEARPGYVVAKSSQSQRRGWANEAAPDIVHACVRGLDEAGRIVDGLGEHTAPRLLVLAGAASEIVADPAQAHARARIIATALAAGCDAVLWVDADRAFFQEFYRKLLHNAPLDAALALTWSGKAAPPLLAVVPHGEFTLYIAAAITRRRLHFSRAAEQLALEQFSFSLPHREFHIAAEIAGRRLHLSRTAQLLGREEPPISLPHIRIGRLLGDGLAGTLSDAMPSRGIEQVVASLDSTAFGFVDLDAPVNASLYDSELHELRLAHDEQDLLAHRTVIVEAAASPVKRAELLDDLQRTVSRYTHVSVRDHATSHEHDATRPLAPGRPYELRVHVAPGDREGLARFLFPEAAVEHLLAQKGEIEVHVHVFHEADDFAFEAEDGSLRVPAFGPSDVLTLVFSLPENPARPLRRLRVALYCRDNLLQSVRLTVPVADGHGELKAALDYCATADFAEVERWRRPALTIVTNDADGSYWFGVRRGETAALADYKEEGPIGHAVAARELLTRAGVRDLQREDYRYEHALYAPNLAVDARRLSERCEVLVDLARAGWQLYDTVFATEGVLGDTVRRLLDDGAQVFADDLVQIARCRKQEPTLPWALLYDQPLDLAETLEVCPVFLSDLGANEWARGDDGKRRLTVLRDKLDTPAACRARPTCPLDDPGRRNKTVCPFGFWGLRYQLEQPLQAIDEEAEAKGSLGLVVRIPAPAPARATMCKDPGLLESAEHAEELPSVLDAGGELRIEDDVAGVRRLLADPGAPICYLFCHGEKLPRPLPTFGFRFADKKYVIASDFHGPTRASAPFLLILNACGSTALLPEESDIWLFLHRFRAMGAEGVIGTEALVHTHLARPFGLDLMARALRGETLGRAMLAIRRDMLRQLNPMGLAYTLHGPAGLHLCRDRLTCGHCRSP